MATLTNTKSNKVAFLKKKKKDENVGMYVCDFECLTCKTSCRVTYFVAFTAGGCLSVKCQSCEKGMELQQGGSNVEQQNIVGYGLIDPLGN